MARSLRKVSKVAITWLAWLLAPYTFFPHKCQLLLQAFDIQSIWRLCHLTDKINDMVLFFPFVFFLCHACWSEKSIFMWTRQCLIFAFFFVRLVEGVWMQVKNHLHIKEGNLRSHKAFCFPPTSTFDGKLYNVVKDKLGTFTPMSFTDIWCRLKITNFSCPANIWMV